jgi:hypothetical protein
VTLTALAASDGDIEEHDPWDFVHPDVRIALARAHHKEIY